jgi:hypothetical protein
MGINSILKPIETDLILSRGVNKGFNIPRKGHQQLFQKRQIVHAGNPGRLHGG